MNPNTRVRGHVLRPDPYEDITWNQKRFPKPRFFRVLSTLRWVDGEMMTPGFLLTTGNYGSLLIGPVWHDGDRYRRRCPRRHTVYGSVRILKELGMPDARLLSEPDVVRLALERQLFLRLRRHSDGMHFDVAMLTDFPDAKGGRPRGCGIYLTHDTVVPLNPEEPAHHNYPEERFSVVESIARGTLETALRERLDRVSVAQ